MPNIIVCYKWVYDEQDLKVNSDLSVDFSRAKGKISDYDRNAIETGMQCATAGDEVVTLTYGSESAQKSLKDALSRGPSTAFWVCDSSAEGADGARTANVLAAAAKKIEDIKLIVCAEGAADTYAHEVGPRIGALLNLPVISNVIALSIEGDSVMAARKLNDSLETVRATLPVVITVLPEIYKAPIPGLKMVLGAAKKPIVQYSLSDLDLDATRLAPKTAPQPLKGFMSVRKNIMFAEGEMAERVKLLVQSLVKEGALV